MNLLFQIAMSGGNTVEPTVQYDVNKASAVYQNNCVTPTSDASGQMMHPGVAELNGVNWNGYPYWMCGTPFTGNNNQVENPEILRSSDGDTWEVPAGLTNPLSGPPVENYFADTDIVLGYDNNMYAIWRHFVGGADPLRYKVYMRSSSDGVDWGSSDFLLAELADGGGSPCLLKDKDVATGQNDIYALYDIDFLTGVGNQRFMYRREASSLNNSWGSATQCTFNNQPADKYLWHMDIGKLPNGQYYCLMSLSNENTGTDTNMWLAYSDDGLDWTFGDKPIINNSPEGIEGWIKTRVYRGSGIYVDNNGNPYLDTWMSGETSNIWETVRFRIYLLQQDFSNTSTGTLNSVVEV